MSAEFDFDQFCRTLVRETPDAVIFADRDGVIRLWNAGGERIFGFKEAEATGRSLDIIIPQDLRARHWSGFHETMRTGRTRYGAGTLWQCGHCGKTADPFPSNSRSCRFAALTGRSSGSPPSCAMYMNGRGSRARVWTG